LIDSFGTEYGWRVSDILELTLSELSLINDARIIRDNSIYQEEKESERKSRKGKNSGISFTKASDDAPTGKKKGGALNAEQALAAFEAGVWSKK
jgi:hypothetical protein